MIVINNGAKERVMGSLSRGWLVIALVAALGGAGAAIFLTRSPEIVVNGSGEATTTVSLYWLNSQGDQLVAVPTTIREKSTLPALRTALNSLIKEPPTNPNLSSAIPRGTEIIDLKIEGSDIHINLSSAFQEGGGSTSVQGRLLQLLYTLTSIDTKARVYLSIEGKPVENLGGEGIEVKQPMTRQDYPDSL
jgi:spore germination protein GerM